jgi:hypothetical protein
LSLDPDDISKEISIQFLLDKECSTMVDMPPPPDSPKCSNCGDICTDHKQCVDFSMLSKYIMFSIKRSMCDE